MAKYKKVVPVETPEQLQIGAGMIVFGMTTEEIVATLDENGVLQIPEANIFGLTSGGLTINCTPTPVDFGSNMDDVQEMVAELQFIQGYKTNISGTMVTAGTIQLSKMVGNANVVDKGNGLTEIVPQHGFIPSSKFETIHAIGQQGANSVWLVRQDASFNTGGLAKKTVSKDKSTFDIDLKGHYPITNMEDCPMKFYVLEDAPEPPVGG